MMIMTAIRLAARMDLLGTESAFEVLARAKALEAAGNAIIHLEIGEPDFPTAPHIVEAAVEALHAGHTHYVPAPGIPALRESVAAFLDRTGRMPGISPQRVIVTPGAKPIMFYTIMALAGPGDEVLYPDPGFPMYESITAFAGATPVPIPLREANQFRIDTEELESLISERTRLLVLNTPHNPCGSALTAGDCAAIAEIAQRHDLIVLSDEVYWAIRYGSEPHASVLDYDGMADRTILLDGWSKTFAMTGWRLGYGVFPPALVEPITRLAINSVSCTSAFSQYAAIAALDGPWDAVVSMVEEFRRRRDFIVTGLNELPGVSCVEPAGAFYAFPRIESAGTGTGMTSAELAARLLAEAGVAALSGTAFGPHGEGYLRFSYANSVDNIAAALKAMAGLLLDVVGHGRGRAAG
jgi:aspartate aminotransferase